MPLIRNGRFAEDGWAVFDPDSELPLGGDVIVPFAWLKQNASAIRGRNGRMGVMLDNAVDPDELKPYLAALDLVALHFPAFTDGRAYSQARQLRNQLGFAGELRATGAVLADQAAFMTRVGFDSFEVGENVSLDVWNKALRSMTVTYQRGYAGPETTRDAATA